MSRRHANKTVRKKLNVAPDFQVSSVGVSEEDHPEFKAAMTKAAEAAVAELPDTIKLLKDALRTHNPLAILSAFTAYGLTVFVGKKGVSDRKPLEGILPHHAELLQALLLTIPLEEWGKKTLTPQIMETVFETMPKLAHTFFFQRVLEGQKVTDEQQLAVLSLQERIRMHTLGIRNWGYMGDVMGIILDLYSPLDIEFAAHHGFKCSDLINVMASVLGELERRHSQHIDILGKVMRGKKPQQIFDLYFEHVPDLVGSPKSLASRFPNINREGAMALVMSHMDLRHQDNSTFTAQEAADVSGKDASACEAMLKSISLDPGSLAGTKEEHLFLGNPIWHAPAIKLKDSYLIPMPQAFFSHVHRIMEKLATEAGLKEKLEKARNIYLENKLESSLRTAFPTAVITPEAKWKIGSEQFETDALMVLDRTVLIAEAKANRLTPEGLRGAPDRVKRHVRDMILDPSVQSERLAGLIEQAKNGDGDALATVQKLGIIPGDVDQIIRISVTLDDFSILSSSVGELKKVGWVPADHHLAPTISLADLLCVMDILDNPLLVLHYLSERIHFQDSYQLMGDELDFLGLYLVTGFNTGKPDKEHIFSPSGMSAPIDKYYNSRDAGVNIPKPTMAMSPYFRQIVSRLCERSPPGWTTTGLYLLSAASPSEQRAVERQLHKLRKSVRRNYKDPKHINTLSIAPPLARKARVGFYLFPEELRGNHRETMKILVNGELSEEGVDVMALLGRSTENWGVPYETVMLARDRQ
ncbi:hypothetical protein [Rhizobium sp. Rhizsp42]|uniref:hypothetical protein n=1 Tax=Rhizobium sp. Rhizsp42 TaxID=3243034 RepID=UPI0039AEA0AF